MKQSKETSEEDVKEWMKLQRRNLGGILEEDFIKEFRGDILHHTMIFRQEIQEANFRGEIPTRDQDEEVNT